MAVGRVGESTRGGVGIVSQPILLRRPGLFLGLFALVTALSLPVWNVSSPYYMHGVVWVVNSGLSLFGAAVRLPSTLVREGVYPEIAGAIALFVVTPRRSLVWKLRWHRCSSSGSGSSRYDDTTKSKPLSRSDPFRRNGPFRRRPIS